MAYVHLGGHTGRMTDGELLWNGRRILTIDLAVHRYRLTRDAATKAIQRFVRAKKLKRINPPPLGKTPAYWLDDLDAAMRDERPGKGANLRKRAG